MTGSSKQTTTQSTASEPWAAAQPALKTGLEDAQGLYKTGVGSQAYTGSTVVPFAQQTTQGMGGIQNLASQQAQSDGLTGEYQRSISRGGFNAPQAASLSGLQGFASGGMATSNQAQRGIASSSLDPSYSERNLGSIASGGMLDRLDPNFERSLAVARNNATNQIGMGAAASGRYGSAIHQGNVAREVGDYEASQRVGQYNQERQNQMAANQMLDSQRMAGLGMSLNASNSASGIESDNYGRQMAALQQQFNAGQQGFNNLGTAYEGMKAPASDMMGVGSMYEDLAGRLKNDQLRIFQEQQNSPWNQLGRLNSVATGAGSMGGTSNSTAQVPGQSPFATGLGYASTGMGLLGSARNLGWF
jgi:hypothetical protein